MKRAANLSEMEDQAIEFLDRGMLRHAEKVLKRMLLLEPRSVAAHFHLARVYRRTKEYPLALHHARRTLKLNPNERNACLNLGLIHEIMDHDERAAFWYRRELARNAASEETLWNIGRLCFKRHQWARASRYLQRCYDLGFGWEIEDTVDKLGICYHKLGDLQAYIRLFVSYVQMAPDAAWAHANLGRAQLSADNFKDAWLRLHRAQELGYRRDVRPLLAHAKKMLASSRGQNTVSRS